MSLLKKMPLSKESHDKIKADEEASRELLRAVGSDEAVLNGKMYQVKVALENFSDDPESYRSISGLR